MGAISRFLIVLGLISAFVWLAYLGLDKPTLGTDDAHIFFVYADNLLSGEGAVYNPGGERVEGFSSPLWLLIVTAAFALSSQPEVLLLVVNIMLICGAITLLWMYVDGSRMVTLAGLLFLVWVISSPSFVIWVSLSLMDTALWASLLIVGTVVALSRANPWIAALVFSLVLLARPEGMLWALVLIAVFAIFRIVRSGYRTAWREVRIPLAIYALVVIALIGLRMAYFGYPLPNTYYAKMSTDLSWNLVEGARYLATFIFFNWHVLVVGIGSAIAVFFLNGSKLVRDLNSPSPKATEDPNVRYVSISMIGMAAIFIPVIVGGDHFDLSRFYQAVWPLFFLFGLAMYRALGFDIGSPARYVLAALAVGAMLLVPRVNWINQGYKQYILHEFTFAKDGRALGETLTNMFEGDLPSIGVILAGGIALEYEGTVIDVMGLNNVEMAHSPGDRRGKKNHAAFHPDTFYEQRVDLFVPMTGPRETLFAKSLEEHCLRNFWLKGLLEDEQFIELYQPAIISNSEGQVLAYVDRKLMDGLNSRGFDIESLTYPGCH